MLRSILLISGIVLCIYLGIVLLLWARQERIVFQPPRPPFDDVADIRVNYTATDGQALFGYLVRPDTSALSKSHSRTVLLAFHGNAEIAAWSLPWARELARRSGALVLLPEYRGYAGLTGRPSYAGSKLDALAAWEYMRAAHNALPEHTVIYGHSLGSAIGVELAIAIRPRALVLEAPFTSARAMATRLGVPGILPLWRAISRVHYDTRHHVAELDVPVSVVHGAQDMVTPVYMGREVYAAARRKGELLVLDDVGHNNVVEGGGDRYWRWLFRALRIDPEQPHPLDTSTSVPHR